MTVVYNGDSTGIVDHADVSVTNPTDGDGLSAASNNAAIQTLANETQHLKESALLRDGDTITGALSFDGGALQVNESNAVEVTAPLGIIIGSGGSQMIASGGTLAVEGEIVTSASGKVRATTAQGMKSEAAGGIYSTVQNGAKFKQDDGVGYSDGSARTRLKMILPSEFMPNTHNDSVSTAILGYSVNDGLYTHDFGSTLMRYANFTLPRTAALTGMRVLGKNTSGSSRTLTFESRYYNRIDTLVGGTPPATPAAYGDYASAQVLTWTAGEYAWKTVTMAGGSVSDFYEGLFAHVSLVFGAGASSLAAALLVFGVELHYTISDLTAKDV